MLYTGIDYVVTGLIFKSCFPFKFSLVKDSVAVCCFMNMISSKYLEHMESNEHIHYCTHVNGFSYLMGGSRGGGGGGRNPDPPGIARLLIVAMLKFSVRPLLGIWTHPEKIFWIRACIL